MIYTLHDYMNNGFSSSSVSLVSLIAIFFGVWIIIAKNPVMAILFLIGLFISVSLYLIISGLNFMGLSYLLVYVGAVSILFIFILMLINVRVSELSSEGENSIALAIITVLSFNYTISPISTYSNQLFELVPSYLSSTFNSLVELVPKAAFDVNNVESVLVKPTNVQTANVFSASWESCLTQSNHITAIGNIMYTHAFMLLIITGLILLIAMVGTISVTKTKSTNS